MSKLNAEAENKVLVGERILECDRVCSWSINVRGACVKSRGTPTMSLTCKEIDLAGRSLNRIRKKIWERKAKKVVVVLKHVGN